MSINASGTNFNCNVAVDVIRLKSYVDSFLDSTSAPVRNSIKKLEIAPNQIVAVLLGKQIRLLAEPCKSVAKNASAVSLKISFPS